MPSVMGVCNQNITKKHKNDLHLSMPTLIEFYTGFESAKNEKFMPSDANLS